MNQTFPPVYASTDEGLRLAVVDVTNPIFMVTSTDAEIETLADRFVQESADRPELSPAVRAALAQSVLGKGLMAASSSFLSGVLTYLLKLGPDHLPDPLTDIDRRIAASFPGFATRIRLQDMARLIADGLTAPLTADPARPLCFINIGGGPAADSWNALLHLRAEQPALLRDRAVTIAVLDVDDSGPRFGARAVAALSASGGPLSGVAIDFRHVAYNWSDASGLAALLGELAAGQAMSAISSEGALFEYGSDAEIGANLAQIRTAVAPDAIVVGSVTRDAAPTRAARAASRVPTYPRTLEAFERLAREAGWLVDRAIERPFTYDVRLAAAL
jgi:hypothetical protein